MPAHTREGHGDIQIEQFLEEVLRHALKDREYILLLHEAHLTVDLCELWLAVGT